MTLNQRNAEADAYRARLGQSIEEADHDFVTRLVSWLSREKGAVNLCEVGVNVARHGAGGRRATTGGWLLPVLSRDPRVHVDTTANEPCVRVASAADAEFAAAAAANPQPAAARAERPPRRCTYFNTLRGCKKGDACEYAHVRRFASVAAAADEAGAHGADASGERPCAYFNTRRGCRRGDGCPYEHTARVPPPLAPPAAAAEHDGAFPAATDDAASTAPPRATPANGPAFLDAAEDYLRAQGVRGMTDGMFFSQLGNSVRKPLGVKGFTALFSTDPLARFEIIGSGVTARVRLSGAREQLMHAPISARFVSASSVSGGESATSAAAAAAAAVTAATAPPRAPVPVSARIPDASPRAAMPGVAEFREAAAIFLEACGGEHGPSILISKLGKDVPKPPGAPSISSILSSDPARRFEVFSGQQGREAVRLRALARAPGSYVAPAFPDALNPEEEAGYYADDTEQEYTALLRLSRMSTN
jgi:hypothetical protein